jgi:ABC-type glycerol-3-phosphate transport system substrate-binding protein
MKKRESNSLVTRRELLKAGGAVALGGLAAVGNPRPLAAQSPSKPHAGKTLNVFSQRLTFTDSAQSQVASFEAKTGIKVKFDVYAEAEARQKLPLELAGGTGAFDVTWVSWDDIPKFVRAKWIVPLDPYLKDPNLTGPGEVDLADFLKIPLEEGKWDNQLYGLPVFIGTQLFYYRTDIVKKPPETFEELMATAKEVHNKPIPAFALRGGRARGVSVWPFPIFLYGFGGKFFRDFPKDLHPALDSPEAIRAVEYWVELNSKYGIPNVASAGFDEVLLALAEGKAAMGIEGAPLAARLYDPARSKVHDKLGMQLVPRGPAGRFPPLGCHYWALPASSKNKEAGWEFIKWAASREAQLQGALATGHIAVTLRSVWQDPAFGKKYNWGGGKFLSLFTESADKGTRYYWPPLPEWPQVGDRVGIALSEALTGQKTAAQAMKDAQKEMYEFLKKAGHYTD